MRGDSRLSRMLHVLIHLGRRKEAATSEMIARMLNTNPVVVRRTMAGLRERGYVQSEKGHGGGWKLTKSLDQISLLDVYEALERPELFCLVSASDHAGCLVEISVNEAGAWRCSDWAVARRVSTSDARPLGTKKALP